jgi:hypothetical protein
MRQRGRVSGEAIGVPFLSRLHDKGLGAVADRREPFIPAQRSGPPEDFDEEEAIEWRLIVERMPPDWFPRETHTMLTELCQVTVSSRQVGRRLREIRGSSSANSRYLEPLDGEVRDLIKMKAELAKVISNLSTKLRITNINRIDGSKAKFKVVKATTADAKPWNDRPSASDAGREGHRLDRDHVLRPGGPPDRPSGEAGDVAEERDPQDLRQ